MTALEPLPPDIEDVLAAARVVVGPDAAARGRLLARITVSAGAATPAAAATAAKGGLLAVKPLATLAIVFGLGAAAGAGVHAAWTAADREVAPARPAVAAPTPSVPADSVPAPPLAVATVVPAPTAIPAEAAVVPAPMAIPAEAAVVPAPTAVPARPPITTPRSRPAARAPTARPTIDLAAESALIERARMAMARGDAGAALDAVAEHDRRFHDGSLAEERDAVRIQALARAGRLDDARARARAFRAKFSRSLFLSAIDRSIE